MPFLWKKSDCKNWIAQFTDRTGRRRNKSTGTPNRKEAEKIAIAYEEAARKKRTSSQVRKVIVELHREITGEEVKSKSVREYFTEWLATKKAAVAPATLAFYKIATTKFEKWLGTKATEEIGSVTAAQIIAFRDSEAAKVAPKTVNHEIKCLKMVFRTAHRDALISENPLQFVETVKRQPSRSRRPFSVDELQAVLRVSDPEWRSMILFAFYTGQRLADVASLTWDNLDLATDELRLVTRKTGKRLAIPLPAPLRRHIDALPVSDVPGSPIHPIAFAILERQGKSGGLSNQFADLLASAGLRQKKVHRKGSGPRSANELSFHSLRSTATTLLHEAGIPPSVAQELIGHDSAEIHQGYVKVGRDALRAAAAAMPDITSK